MTLSDKNIDKTQQTSHSRIKTVSSRPSMNSFPPFGAKLTVLGVLCILAEGQPLRFKRQLAFCLIVLVALGMLAVMLGSSSVIGKYMPMLTL